MANLLKSMKRGSPSGKGEPLCLQPGIPQPRSAPAITTPMSAMEPPMKPNWPGTSGVAPLRTTGEMPAFSGELQSGGGRTAAEPTTAASPGSWAQR